MEKLSIEMFPEAREAQVNSYCLLRNGNGPNYRRWWSDWVDGTELAPCWEIRDGREE